ncbi:MAG TPA: ABC transporter permease subunit [Chthoniobacterales bacterium]|jgi:putative spermidine/putrescine transport system permease protein
MTKFKPGLVTAHLLTWLLLIVVIAPLLVVILGAFLNVSFLGLASEQWAARKGDGIFNHGWFAYVFHLYGSNILFSLLLAGLSVVIGAAISLPGAYILATCRWRGLRIFEEVVLLPLSIPGIAMSIGLIEAYITFRGQWWLILCGHILYTVPLMTRVLTNSLRSFDIARLELVAQSLGAGWWHRFVFVVVPNLRHSLIVGSLLVFAVSWGEFNVSYLLNTPLHQTYPAALYATFTANSFQVSSAATTIFLALIIPILFALQWLGGDEFTHVEQSA